VVPRPWGVKRSSEGAAGVGEARRAETYPARTARLAVKAKVDVWGEVQVHGGGKRGEEGRKWGGGGLECASSLGVPLLKEKKTITKLRRAGGRKIDTAGKRNFPIGAARFHWNIKEARCQRGGGDLGKKNCRREKGGETKKQGRRSEPSSRREGPWPRISVGKGS